MKRINTIKLIGLLIVINFTVLPVAGINQQIKVFNSSSIKEANLEHKSLFSSVDNPWTSEDEGDHYPCGCEWWMFYVALDLADGTHWDASSTFQYSTRQNENGTELAERQQLMYYFDRDNKKCYDFSSYTYKEDPFTFKKNVVDLKFYNSTIKGLYPNYIIHIEDEEQRFILDIELNASSLPHWAAEEAANGYFPWGLGLAKYGFITKLNASGNLTIEGVKSSATGIGYFEHAWGNFSYNMGKPISKIKEFMKNLPIFIRFAKWFLSEQTYNKPQTLMFSTDNVFGYDWIWAAFDNGWSLHSGIFHLFDCVEEGPAPGVVSLNTDKETYYDFADISVKYTRRFYVEQADAYLPLDIEITAIKGDKTLHLICNSTTEPFSEINMYPMSRFSCGNSALQTAGVIEGYYKDKEQNVSLHGVCTIGPFRDFLYTKYNSLKITVLRPPQGLGFSVELVSHLLGYEMLYKMQLRPYPDFQFYIRRCPDIPPVKPIEKQFIDSSVFYVGGSGPNNYTKIQDAIDNATDGDTVFVYSGLYYENLIVNKSVHLIGEGKDKAIIKAGKKDGIKIIENNVEVSGFTIDSEKAGSNDDSPIDISSHGNFIHDNNVIKSEWYGIYIFNASDNVIENNSIIDCDIGIWLCRSYENTVCNNNITFSKWVGIWLWPFSKNNNINCNNFMKNKIHCQNSDTKYKNKWDKNYWDDYIGLKFKNLADLNKDGIGSMPYRITRFEKDRHPMMKPYII